MSAGLLGLAFEQVSALDEAVEALEKAAALSEGSPFFRVVLARGYASAGRREKAIEMLRDLEGERPRVYTTPYYIAAVHAALDQKDEAFQWLDRAYDVRDSWLVMAGQDPTLDGLRSDARFDDLLRRIKLRT